MKLPSQIESVSFYPGLFNDRPCLYPPPGFQGFAEAELGNGDCFGLYWPVGKEEVEPIVAEMWHDEWTLQPAFSCLSAFLSAYEKNEREWPEQPSIAEDPRSPVALFEAARTHLRTQQVDAAVAQLETAITVLPEYTNALSLLWAQYVRQGRAREALPIALRAIKAPPSFGGAPVKMLRWLQSQSEAGALAADPIWQNRHALKLTCGGTKENGDYPIYRAAIKTYIDGGQIVEACVLMQTYGELMNRETVSFQERYQFSPDEHLAWMAEISARLPSGPRFRI
jgi:tetratricopeptide (TPR) repeat protein